MSDNPNKRKPEDSSRINIHQDWELTYWARELGVSKATIIQAVSAVGVMVKDVKKHLSKK